MKCFNIYDPQGNTKVSSSKPNLCKHFTSRLNWFLFDGLKNSEKDISNLGSVITAAYASLEKPDEACFRSNQTVDIF